MPQAQAWYELAGEDSAPEQGDFIVSFPVLTPPPSLARMAAGLRGDGEPHDLVLETADVVVLTQSCDLQDAPADFGVVLCPRYSYLGFAAARSDVRGPDGWGKLVRGHIVGAYLLDRCAIPGHELDYQVVDLRRIFSVPHDVVAAVARRQAERIRLVSPYREHLSQAFAMQFMRIGLPSSLPRKYPYLRA